ncbi:transglutaminase-like domain-containing protein [Fulvivirga sedimenti]|uniref:Transglutaminase domain-containing protein n=1 Tax=Fulvivirga sedimenti TaxID=2879465 RepID=A0A9X1KWA2_9BACT|nr:transglutaminase domain-containing protein [Fulvivirga sedimenti]MCA6073774.1 transglutaminase domain-containing protein [Fulvivirga sedimenti]
MSRLSFAVSCISLALFVISCNAPAEKEKPQKKARVTIQEVDAGIRENIDAITKAGDGYFPIHNDSVDLKLKLVRVHTEYLSVLGQNRFFACVDLATEGGDVYDVDFFLEGEPGNMKVTSTDVHKLNGKPYYTWKQAEDKTWYTVAVENASNDLLGVVEGTDKFNFTYSARLANISGPGHIWIPIAQSDEFQDIELLSIQSPGDQEIVTEQEYGNKVLHIALKPEHSNQEIIIEYNVVRREKGTYIEENPDTLKYLLPSALMPVGDRFSIISADVISQKQANSPLTKARALYDHVIDEMRYAKEGVYGTGDANYACDSKSGNCTEFHSYFISLARSAGIPARFAVGAAIPSERNEGGVDGYHCWAEFYAEGKWWPVDISEANKYSALATYYFGHHPANRIEFSKGRDIKPDPMPEGGPVNFLAYPVLEVEGEPDYVETTFTFARTEPVI